MNGLSWGEKKVAQRWSPTFVKSLSFTRPSFLVRAAAVCSAISLAACTGGVGGSNSSAQQLAPVPVFSVGGTVSGLAGQGLVLQDNGGDSLAVSSDGSFTFKTALPSGNAYNVSVLSQPSGPTQTCSAGSGVGNIGDSNVTNVTITCKTKAAGQNDTIGGTTTGLVGSGLVLQNNGTDNLAIPSPGGSFTFGTSLVSGTPYHVTVLTQPTNPAQTCLVSAGTGTTGAADVNNVAVACTVNQNPATNPLVVKLVGLPSLASVLLQDNLGETITATANGAYTFKTLYSVGSPFALTAAPTDANQSISCTVTPPSGVAAAPAGGSINVTVSCSATTGYYSINATVNVQGGGALGSGLQLQDNGGDSLAIPSAGSFTFRTPVASGSTYNVTVASQPVNPSQTCSVAHGTGTVASSAATASVTCDTNFYPVNVNVTGLQGTLVLQDNLGSNLTVNANGQSTFKTSIPSGSAYSVTVLTQPVYQSGTILSQTCTPGANAAGIIGAAGVTVSVACTTNPYPVSVNVSGLQGTLVLQDNGGANLTVASNGVSTFSTQLASGSGYNVTILTQPTYQGANHLSQTCSLGGNATGTVTAAGVTVNVNCTTNLYLVKVNVSGLQGALVLQDNGASNLTVQANGVAAFNTAVPSGGTYNVTVLTQPSYQNSTQLSQTCTPGPNPAGTVGTADIVVTIACTTNVYPVSVNVAGLVGTLVMQNNGGANLTISSSGQYSFSPPIASGSAYSVAVLTQPTYHGAAQLSQTCTLGPNATGTITSAPVTVNVSCSTNFYTVSVTVSGLVGSPLVLADNGNDFDQVIANGTTTFNNSIASGGAYAVSVTSTPTASNYNEICTVANASGIIASSNITLFVTCTVSYAVTVSVTSSPAAFQGTLTLSNAIAGISNRTTVNQTDSLPITSPGNYSFPTYLQSGSTYSVTIQTQPGVVSDGKTATICTPFPSTTTGTVTNAPISISVACVQPLGFAYVTNSADSTIIPFVIQSGGQLLQFGAPVPSAGTASSNTANGPSGLAVDPATFYSNLYVSNETTNNISRFKVDPNTGALTALASSPFAFAGLLAPTSVTTGINGSQEVLYVTNAGDATNPSCSGSGTSAGSSVSSFTISSTDQSLTALGTCSIGPSTTAVAGTFLTSPSEYFGSGYYTANAGSNNVSQFTAGTGGAVIADVPAAVATGVSPSSIVSSDPWVFVANSGDGSLWTYLVDDLNGTLSPITNAAGQSTQPFCAYPGAQALSLLSFSYAVSATNIVYSDYLYVTGTNGLLQFNITQTYPGNLSCASGVAAQQSTVASSAGPVATFTDGSNGYIYVVDQGRQEIFQFTATVDASTGFLGTPVNTGTNLATGSGPSSILVLPRPYTLNLLAAPRAKGVR